MEPPLLSLLPARLINLKRGNTTRLWHPLVTKLCDKVQFIYD